MTSISWRNSFFPAKPARSEAKKKKSQQCQQDGPGSFQVIHRGKKLEGDLNIKHIYST